MSRLRETNPAPSWKKSPDRFDSLWMIRDSVRRRDGLAYGALHDNDGDACAIGGFFDDNPNLCLKETLIDEVAAYNDSIPKHLSKKTRKRKVLEWLNAKIRSLTGPPTSKATSPSRS